MHAVNLAVNPESISIDPAAGKKRVNDGRKGMEESADLMRRVIFGAETPCSES